MRSPTLRTEKSYLRVLNSLFSSEIYDFSGYSFQLTIIFTVGKDEYWSKYTLDPNVAAVMTGAFLMPSTHVAAGGAMVDITACVLGARFGKASLRVPLGSSDSRIEYRPPTLGDIRYELVYVVAHELFHMIQSWKGGNIYDGANLVQPADSSYIREYLRLVEQSSRRYPKESASFVRAAAYASHPAEQAATRLARGRVERYRKSIVRGDWDDCLPMDALSGLIGGR